MTTSYETTPPKTTVYELSNPETGVLLVQICRPKAMNSIPVAGHWEGEAIWKWFDKEPSLSVAVITGQGPKAFCAGADLMEQRDVGAAADKSARPQVGPVGGFAGLSRRLGKKPVIAAVNGFALGGGFEICLNCDIVISSPNAKFGLPEVQRGLYAGAGGLSRIVRTCGIQIASELALTGRAISSAEAQKYGVVNKVSQSPDSLLRESLDMAKEIASHSPDAIIVTRAGLRESWETGSVERASQLTAEKYQDALMSGENLMIGLQAFAEKKKPKWVASKI
ncbi:enoyl-CoA hydratase, partial [Aureobasidium melanogenum]